MPIIGNFQCEMQKFNCIFEFFLRVKADINFVLERAETHFFNCAAGPSSAKIVLSPTPEQIFSHDIELSYLSK